MAPAAVILPTRAIVPQSVCVFVGCAFHVYLKGLKAFFGTGSLDESIRIDGSGTVRGSASGQPNPIEGGRRRCTDRLDSCHTRELNTQTVYREKIVYFNSRGVIQIETKEVENKAISLGTLD